MALRMNNQVSLFAESDDPPRELPPGATLTRNWLRESSEDDLISVVDAGAWRTDLKRRTQHYGFRYDYTGRGVDQNDRLGPLPAWVEPLSARLVSDGFFDASPDQIIVNEYQPGQGIALHADHPSAFGPVVATLSLADMWPMQFDRPGHEPIREVLLPRCSLLLLGGPARYDWRHGIAKRKTDTASSGRRPRRRRISITFRTVVHR